MIDQFTTLGSQIGDRSIKVLRYMPLSIPRCKPSVSCYDIHACIDGGVYSLSRIHTTACDNNVSTLDQNETTYTSLLYKSRVGLWRELCYEFHYVMEKELRKFTKTTFSYEKRTKIRRRLKTIHRDILGGRLIYPVMDFYRLIIK